MTWGQLAVNALAAILLVVGTWITARFSRKTGEEANETAAAQARTADWAAFTQRLEAWTERQLKEQDERTEQQLAERDRRIDALADEVAEVRSELSTLMRKYRSAVAYIHRLVRQLQKHVDPDDIETPPEEIAPDL